MGDPSTLRYVPAPSAATPIDWTRVPEETKKVLIEQYGYDQETDGVKPLPATIGDLAKMFDETKFFGYFESSTIKVLMDISEFGLQSTPLPVHSHSRSRSVGPRFYMSYLEQVWFFLFTPETKNCIVGHSKDIIRERKNDEKDYEAYYKKMAAKATAIAQAFDVTLEQEVSQGNGEMVEFTKKLGGWTAWTLQSNLETSQFNEAILSLPTEHPAYKALMENFFRSLSSRY